MLRLLIACTLITACSLLCGCATTSTNRIATDHYVSTNTVENTNEDLLFVSDHMFASKVKQIDNFWFNSSSSNRNPIYILNFDHEGRLINAPELCRAAHDIKESLTVSGEMPITNILVVSYGWNHDFESASQDYFDILSAFREHVDAFSKTRSIGRFAIICVAWPSRASSISKLVSDIIPGAETSKLPGEFVDYATFPFSFWSKASLADYIGIGDLRRSLNYLYSETYDKIITSDVQPSMFLVGHSFGCRILSALVCPFHSPFDFIDHRNNQSGDLLGTRSREALAYYRSIRCALFVQPAMTEQWLSSETNFPIIVTQSRYDHLNSSLFPIGNVIINGDGAATFSAFARVLSETSMTNAMSRVLMGGVFRPLFEAFAATESVFSTCFIFPASYLMGEWREFADGGWSLRTNYIANSLAQLPGAEVIIQSGLKNDGWRKGVFDFGPAYESVGRMAYPLPRSVESIVNRDGLSVSNGISYVNMDSVISKSMIWKCDCAQDITCAGFPLWDYTIGWLDPVGSHDDYGYRCSNKRKVQVSDLITLILERYATDRGKNRAMRP